MRSLEKQREYIARWEAKDPIRALLQKAKSAAKQRGLEFTITRTDIEWPTHCPILGVELVYERRKKTRQRRNYPTFDRWDNSKGYVPGNVFIISWRANQAKSDLSAAELRRLADYAERGLR